MSIISEDPNEKQETFKNTLMIPIKESLSNRKIEDTKTPWMPDQILQLSDKKDKKVKNLNEYNATLKEIRIKISAGKEK